MKILSLQPFFGGSHRNFNEQWITYSQHDWTVLSLPDRHWKWRMRHAPLEFADQIATLKSQGHTWDAVIGTDMLDVATLKGLVDFKGKPLTVYFHENQFAYPNQSESAADLHFAFTNFTTMVAAGHIWFNSQFNFESTIEGAERLLRRFPDFQPLHRLAAIRDKSVVQSPGVEVPCEPVSAKKFSSPIVITWAARWEHDKGPDRLEALLLALSDHDHLGDQSIDFRINIVGQSYKNQPAAFARIKQIFGDKIDAWVSNRRRTIDKFSIRPTSFSLPPTMNSSDYRSSKRSRGGLCRWYRIDWLILKSSACYAITTKIKAAQFLYNGTNDAIQKIKSFSSVALNREARGSLNAAAICTVGKFEPPQWTTRCQSSCSGVRQKSLAGRSAGDAKGILANPTTSPFWEVTRYGNDRCHRL